MFICNGTNGAEGALSDGGGTSLNTGDDNDGNEGYYGDNETVVQTAWPKAFESPQQISAELFALYLGHRDSGSTSIDWYIVGANGTPAQNVPSQFKCSWVVANYTALYGAYPPANTLQSYSCPTVPCIAPAVSVAKNGQAQPAANTACTIKILPPNNGIVCKEHDGGTYPENSYFSDCSTTGIYAQTALTQLKALVAKFPNVGAKLLAAKVDFYVFDNVVAYGTFTGAIPQSYTASQFYDKFTGLVGDTTDPSVHPAQVSSIWGNQGTGTGQYPATTLLPTVTIKNSISHEAGHSFDFKANGASYPSYSPEMARVAAIDSAYMKAQDKVSTDFKDYTYWLSYNSGNLTTPLDKHWAELFAEEFAINSGAKKQPIKTSGGQIQSVDTVIENYWQCSSFFTKTWMSSNKHQPVHNTLLLDCLGVTKLTFDC